MLIESIKLKSYHSSLCISLKALTDLLGMDIEEQLYFGNPSTNKPLGIWLSPMEVASGMACLKKQAKQKMIVFNK